MEVKLPALKENYDRQTNQSTDRRRTTKLCQREVSLSIKSIVQLEEESTLQIEWN